MAVSINGAAVGLSNSAGNTTVTTNGARSSNNKMNSINQNQLTASTPIEYIPRTKKPAKDDKCWLKYGKKNVNGYDRAIEITESCRYTYGSCLPNCVGYCWGRVYELSKQYNTELPTTNKLSTGNAKAWYGHNPNLWARGKYPRLGAVICYTSSKYGHVAMVEKINFNKDGSIKSINIGEAAWLKFVFGYNTKYPKNNYDYSKEYSTQGFIYPPYCDLWDQSGTSTTNSTLTKETVAVIENGVAKYIQDYISKYSADDPGFDVEEPPTPPIPTDSEGNDISVGGNIKVVGKGNTSKTGNGKELNELGKLYVLKSYHPGFPFPYRLGPKDGRGVGYWSQSAIQSIT